MLSFSALLVVSSVAVVLMDSGVGAQRTYYFRNAAPASRVWQSNPSVSRNVYRPQNALSAFNPVVANKNTNAWGWPTASAVQQQNRWRLNFDNSIEDNSIESFESSFHHRSSSPRAQQQRPSITSNAWSRPAAVPVRQQPTRWNSRHSDEDRSVESRESGRWW